MRQSKLTNKQPPPPAPRSSARMHTLEIKQLKTSRRCWMLGQDSPVPTRSHAGTLHLLSYHLCVYISSTPDSFFPQTQRSFLCPNYVTSGLHTVGSGSPSAVASWAPTLAISRTAEVTMICDSLLGLSIPNNCCSSHQHIGFQIPTLTCHG